jgi:glycosyltransferase involved in cell wall biosynthesis
MCHSCLATWWQAVRGGGMPEDFRRRAALTRRGLLACDALAAPTSAFAQAIARVYDLPPPHVVHNGRSAPPAAEPSRERQVLTVGRLWDDGKNVAALDAAATLVDAPVFAAGPLKGPNGTELTLRHAKPLGALTPEQVGEWLARTPVFVSSARYEPFGLAVLEAAQAGCALVLSDIPTFRELWDGVAVFTPADDPQAIGGAIQALLDTPDQAAALGAAAQARAGRYTVPAMAEGMLAIYDGLVRGRGLRRRAEAAA